MEEYIESIIASVDDYVNKQQGTFLYDVHNSIYKSAMFIHNNTPVSGAIVYMLILITIPFYIGRGSITKKNLVYGILSLPFSDTIVSKIYLLGYEICLGNIQALSYFIVSMPFLLLYIGYKSRPVT